MKTGNVTKIARTCTLMAFVMVLMLSCQDQAVEHNHQDHAMGDLEGGDGTRSRDADPNGLSVAIRGPYSGRAESAPGWSPPYHGIYWGGHWSGDFWKDNGNGTADYPYSCNEDILLNVKPKSFQGGVKPQAVKGKFVDYGYACASQENSKGGMYQKWEIIAVYNNVDTPLGWVLYAHLDNSPVYALNTVINLNGPVKFSGGTTGACWGSCHVHMELRSYYGIACYKVSPPYVNLNRVGMLGGFNNTSPQCP